MDAVCASTHFYVATFGQAGELSEEILAEYMDNPADQKHKMGSGQSDPFAEEKTSTETAKKDATGGGATENE